MTGTASGYALIGRSYTSDSFESLYQASIATRRRERGGVWGAGRQLPAQNAWLSARRAPVSAMPVR